MRNRGFKKIVRVMVSQFKYLRQAKVQRGNENMRFPILRGAAEVATNRRGFQYMF